MSNSSKRPRKKPSQGRSMDLVGSIFEASVRILKTMGAARFSTRSVADLAGISVGSLYQYFPNKESLIGALIERESKRHVALLESKYLEVQELPLKSIIQTLVQEIIETVRRDKTLLKVILSSTFVVDRLDSIIEAREQLIEFVEKVLRNSEDGLELKNPKVKAYLIVSALAGVVETVIFRKDEPFPDPELVQEVSEMVFAYSSV